MTDIRKVKCPECDHVHTVDIAKELSKGQQWVMRTVEPKITKRPKTLSLICNNCHKRFKVTL